MPTAYVILIYGVLTLVGGVAAFLTVRSVPSIVAGGASGLVLIFAGYLMLRGANYNAGWWIALVVTLALLARFAAASYNSFKVMPGGLMILLSIIALVALLLGRAAPRIN